MENTATNPDQETQLTDSNPYENFDFPKRLQISSPVDKETYFIYHNEIKPLYPTNRKDILKDALRLLNASLKKAEDENSPDYKEALKEAEKLLQESINLQSELYAKIETLESENRDLKEQQNTSEEKQSKGLYIPANESQKKVLGIISDKRFVKRANNAKPGTTLQPETEGEILLNAFFVPGRLFNLDNEFETYLNKKDLNQ